jgi:hypothetical protein
MPSFRRAGIAVALALAVAATVTACSAPRPRPVADDPHPPSVAVDSPTPTPTPTTPSVSAGALTHVATWSYANPQKYTFTMKVSLGGLIRGSEASGVRHPLSTSGFTAGANCSIDPSTDAVIPGSLLVTATTQGFDTPISTRFTFNPVNRNPAGRPISREDGRISVDMSYGKCEGLSTINIGVAGAGVKWPTPMKTGQRGRADFFLVLHDYYSPTAPQGDTAWLDNVALQPMWGGSNVTEADRLKIYQPDISATKGLTLSGRTV